jgi:integrase
MPVTNIEAAAIAPELITELAADLRHTSATLLLRQGVHTTMVQERLGHADIAMTLNRYSHVTPDMQRAAADTLDAAFREVG